MALKEKLKALITNHSPTSSKTGSPVISEPTTGRWPSNVYKPGEPMPRLKYRAPVKKEHKEKLESFNFASSWRRKSHTSIHSPTSSRFPSRRGSRLGAASRNGSIKGGSTSRSNSITGQQDKSRYRHSLRKTQLIAEAAEIQSQMQSYTNSKTFGNTVAEGPDNNGGLTSTVAFMVPPKSAQLVYLTSSDQPSFQPSPLKPSLRTRASLNHRLLTVSTNSKVANLTVTEMDGDTDLPISPMSSTSPGYPNTTFSPTTNIITNNAQTSTNEEEGQLSAMLTRSQLQSPITSSFPASRYRPQVSQGMNLRFQPPTAAPTAALPPIPTSAKVITSSIAEISNGFSTIENTSGMVDGKVYNTAGLNMNYRRLPRSNLARQRPVSASHLVGI